VREGYPVVPARGGHHRSAIAMVRRALVPKHAAQHGCAEANACSAEGQHQQQQQESVELGAQCVKSKKQWPFRFPPG
jgi:hypothetical protein